MALQPDVTELLLAWTGGDAAAESALMTTVYGELRRMAQRRVRGRRGDSLAATALVHETYLKLVDQKRVRWQNRVHFFAVAARLMRRVVVDHARARGAAKRGGDTVVVQLSDSVLRTAGTFAATELPDVQVLALDAALRRLKSVGPRQSAVVELRAFGGLSIEETAEALSISPATAKRDWALGRAWLYRELREV